MLFLLCFLTLFFYIVLVFYFTFTSLILFFAGALLSDVCSLSSSDLTSILNSILTHILLSYIFCTLHPGIFYCMSCPIAKIIHFTWFSLIFIIIRIIIYAFFTFPAHFVFYYKWALSYSTTHYLAILAMIQMVAFNLFILQESIECP